MTMQQKTTKIVSRVHPAAYLLLVSALLLQLGSYLGVRYGWRWLPNDAARLTVISEQILSQGALETTGVSYFGYNYAVLNAFLAHFTGVSIYGIQRIIQPWLIICLVPAIYLVYRALLKSARLAVIATVLLFLQPEFLFESLRSAPGKITWTLSLLFLFMLSTRFIGTNQERNKGAWIVASYLLAFAMIATHPFWAANYLFGIFTILVGALIFSALSLPMKPKSSRLRLLVYAVLTCSLLSFVFVFYLYPPATRIVTTLGTGVDRLFLFLGELNFSVEQGALESNPYHSAGLWVDNKLLPVVNGLTGIILLIAGVAWLKLARNAFLKDLEFETHEFMLWLLSTGFGLIFLLSIIIDQAGVLSANFQVRTAPNLLIVSVPLAISLLRRQRGILSRWSQIRSIGAVLVLALLLTFISLVSLFKVTHEPAISNVWRHFSPNEREAVGWIGENLDKQSVWIGPDTRIDSLVDLDESWARSDLVPLWGIDFSTSRYFLLSDISKPHLSQLGFPEPDVAPQLKIYDNGGAAFYHARPQTPFQR